MKCLKDVAADKLLFFIVSQFHKKDQNQQCKFISLQLTHPACGSQPKAILFLLGLEYILIKSNLIQNNLNNFL